MIIWQIALGLIIAILFGLILGFLYSYIHLRFTHKLTISLSDILFLFLQGLPIIKFKRFSSKNTSPLSLDKNNQIPISTINQEIILSNVSSDNLAQVHTYHEPILKLFAEIESISKTIKAYSGEVLVPLATTTWDVNRSAYRHIPPHLRKKLNTLYEDITLVNNLVWLSLEFNRNNPNIHQNYVNMLSIIDKKLDEIISIPLSQFNEHHETS
jgi:hypothetical protein